ncbi:hypothetical protein D3C81_1997250 [compost metagenome]
MTLGDERHLLRHQLRIERRRLPQNRIRIDLHRNRRQHPFLILLKQIRRQPLG